MRPHHTHPAAEGLVTVAELARLKAAAFDLEQVLTELLGTPAANCAAWRTVRRLLDVYIEGENLRQGPRRRRDGSPRERRPRGEACRRSGVSARMVQAQINRARKRSQREQG